VSSPKPSDVAEKKYSSAWVPVRFPPGFLGQKKKILARKNRCDYNKYRKVICVKKLRIPIMPTFEDLSFSVENFSGKARLFPLPNLVLFPHVMQPLHIFEPRYREMLADALEGDRLIATVLLAPGWEMNYEGRPALYSVACLGRIASYFRLSDGTYNVLLLGLRRIKLINELRTPRRFREAKVVIREDFYPSREKEKCGVMRNRLRDAFLKVLPFLPDAEEQLDQLIDADVPLGMLTDIISYMLDIDIRKKQALLTETDIFRRTELLLKHLAAVIEEQNIDEFGLVSFPPPFGLN
jgi:Lon protease-like protein